MSDLVLKSLDVSNFRSIRGKVHAPLDAKVVLVHGENGAGKTSLLSAVELALTGRIQSLERADPDYKKQLLHRTATEGSVLIKTVTGMAEQSYGALLNPTGAISNSVLKQQSASFFRERVFLPQSLLGQLLQIYQDAGNDAGSPLAQFVGKLLGLDRLDALEAGLKPFVDVRNVRKNVDGWLAMENEKSRLDRMLADERKNRQSFDQQVQSLISELTALCTSLGLTNTVAEADLSEVEVAIADGGDSEAFSLLTDQQRRLASIRREIEAAQNTANSGLPTTNGDEARKAYLQWEEANGAQVNALRSRVQEVLANVSLPADLAEIVDIVVPQLRTEQSQLSDRTSQARKDISRYAAAQDERDVAQRQRQTVDEEVARLSTNSGSLSSALAELTAFISDDVCPVCDRNFGEISQVPLTEHVHIKVRTLSASAERLLTLGRTRSELQVSVERIDRELEAIATRRVDDETLAQLDRRLASIVAVISEIESLGDAIREGSRLRALDVAARRIASEAETTNVSLAAARETLNEFAISVGDIPLDQGESFTAGATRLETFLNVKAARLDLRLSTRRNAADKIATIRSTVSRRKDVDAQIATDLAAWKLADDALARAQAVRDQGNEIRNVVDRVRSSMIRREFNERLNRLWRDLFVRLAPGEPFVPAFRIPESSTQKLQPRLITEHRDGGDAGGTPGAMLSAGNLNTAALTLFIALHLSVPNELPWLILDDPVQSMDDVHIAHFAALLRTLSKEQGRQILIAVHDRQLFEYLKLELSPAFPDDSLLTLELSRGPRRDSVCVSHRFSFKEETALFAA